MRRKAAEKSLFGHKIRQFVMRGAKHPNLLYSGLEPGSSGMDLHQ
jgi:hypothetical protein